MPNMNQIEYAYVSNVSDFMLVSFMSNNFTERIPWNWFDLFSEQSNFLEIASQIINSKHICNVAGFDQPMEIPAIVHNIVFIALNKYIKNNRNKIFNNEDGNSLINTLADILFKLILESTYKTPSIYRNITSSLAVISLYKDNVIESILSNIYSRCESSQNDEEFNYYSQVLVSYIDEIIYFNFGYQHKDMSATTGRLVKCSEQLVFLIVKYFGVKPSTLFLCYCDLLINRVYSIDKIYTNPIINYGLSQLGNSINQLLYDEIAYMFEDMFNEFACYDSIYNFDLYNSFSKSVLPIIERSVIEDICEYSFYKSLFYLFSQLVVVHAKQALINIINSSRVDFYILDIFIMLVKRIKFIELGYFLKIVTNYIMPILKENQHIKQSQVYFFKILEEIFSRVGKLCLKNKKYPKSEFDHFIRRLDILNKEYLVYFTDCKMFLNQFIYPTINQILQIKNTPPVNADSVKNYERDLNDLYMKLVLELHSVMHLKDQEVVNVFYDFINQLKVQFCDLSSFFHHTCFITFHFTLNENSSQTSKCSFKLTQFQIETILNYLNSFLKLNSIIDKNLYLIFKPFIKLFIKVDPIYFLSDSFIISHIKFLVDQNTSEGFDKCNQLLSLIFDSNYDFKSSAVSIEKSFLQLFEILLPPLYIQSDILNQMLDDNVSNFNNCNDKNHVKSRTAKEAYKLATIIFCIYSLLKGINPDMLTNSILSETIIKISPLMETLMKQFYRQEDIIENCVMVLKRCLKYFLPYVNNIPSIVMECGNLFLKGYQPSFLYLLCLISETLCHDTSSSTQLSNNELIILLLDTYEIVISSNIFKITSDKESFITLLENENISFLNFFEDYNRLSKRIIPCIGFEQFFSRPLCLRSFEIQSRMINYNLVKNIDSLIKFWCEIFNEFKKYQLNSVSCISIENLLVTYFVPILSLTIMSALFTCSEESFDDIFLFIFTIRSYIGDQMLLGTLSQALELISSNEKKFTRHLQALFDIYPELTKIKSEEEIFLISRSYMDTIYEID